MKRATSPVMLEGQSTRLICMDCRAVDRVETVAPGSPAKELLLWLLVIPGPFYAWWRWRNKRKVCAICGQSNLVPDDAPLVRQTYPDLVVPRTQRSVFEILRNGLFGVVLGAGLGMVALLTVSILFPEARGSKWLGYLGMGIAVVVVGHPVIGVIHLVLHSLESGRKRRG
jgi:hypothetical protein